MLTDLRMGCLVLADGDWSMLFRVAGGRGGRSKILWPQGSGMWYAPFLGPNRARNNGLLWSGDYSATMDGMCSRG